MKLAALIQPLVCQQIESLYQTFLKLDDSKKTLLMVLTVIYKPKSQKKFAQVIDILARRRLLPNPKKEYPLSTQKKEQLNSTTVINHYQRGLTTQ